MQMTPPQIFLGLVFAGLFICPASAAAAGATVGAGSTAAVWQKLKADSSVTPVQKVLELLKDLKAKTTQTKVDEINLFEKYDTWADAEKLELEFQIEQGKKDVERYSNHMQVYYNEQHELDNLIEEIKRKVLVWQGEKKEAEELRQNQHDHFVIVQGEYVDTIAAVKKAVEVVKMEDVSIPQAAVALMQKMEHTTPGMPRVMAAFLEMSSSSVEDQEQLPGAPSVAAYEFKSTGVLEMLKELYRTFKEELREAEDQESTVKYAHEKEMQGLKDEIKYSLKDQSEHEEAMGKKQVAYAETLAKKNTVLKEIQIAEKTLLELNAAHATKKETYAANQAKREQELDAIVSAIDTISAQNVKGLYNKKIGLMQLSHVQQAQPRAYSLLQTDTSNKLATVRRTRSFLQGRAKTSASSRAESGPFDDVVDQMENLIVKLREEATAEELRHQACQDELNTNQDDRDRFQAQVDNLKATIGSLGSQIMEEKLYQKKLRKHNAKLADAIAEATNFRSHETKENKETEETANEAALAVRQAVDLLNDFYQNVALVQKRVEQVHHAEPDYKGETYKGEQAAATSILTVLETIEGDFLALKAATISNEASALATYNAFVTDCEGQKSQNERFEQESSDRQTEKEGQVKAAYEDLGAHQKELDTANAYYKELKAACLDINVNVEDRFRARANEIKNLKEAYTILDSKKLLD